MLNHRPTLSHHAPRRPRHRSRVAEFGFTLVEVLVCIAILGVVVIPLSATMLVGFRSTESSESGLNASTNRDQLAEQFTKDVAQVDAAGVSTDSSRTCGSPSNATLFVNLNRTRLVSGSPVIDRISYWVTGSGINIDIERYACTNVSATSSSTDATRIVVADDLGCPTGNPTVTTCPSGRSRNDVVLAIYDETEISPGVYVGRVPCNEFQCGFEVDGRHKFQVTAQRRLFGAGVPIEAGKVYSSSYTRLQKSGVAGGYAYDFYATTSKPDPATNQYTPVGHEAVFSDQLTLPAGLEGPTKLSVKFAVYSATADRWLNSAGTAFDVGTRTDGYGTFKEAAAAHKIAGDYTGSQWHIPLRVGDGPYATTNNIATYGGEYRIFTFLEPVGQPAKVFGGANGFPFWMDWRPQNSVFVKAGNPADNDGLTPATATGSLAKAYQQSALGWYNRANIVVSTGTFTEKLDLYSGNDSIDPADTTGNSSNNRTLTGGHDPTTWLRGPVIDGDLTSGASTTTQIVAPTNADHVFSFQYRIGQRLRQVAIKGGTGADLAAGTTTYGVQVGWTSDVEIERAYVKSANGRPGATPTTPAPAADGCRGVDGTAHSTSANAAYQSAPTRVGNGGATYTGPQPGPAPCLALRTATSAPDASEARKGGQGGGGGGNDGSKGTDGSYDGTSALPGTGGSAGKLFNGACNPGAGSAGYGPTASPAGNAGTWVINDGSVPRPTSTSLWPGMPIGNAGGTGTWGFGGGGGGGGGGNACMVASSDRQGASGGSGGQGGLGGGAGQPGQPGGGSFGLYVYGNSTVRANDAMIFSGNGGKGADGGKGGDGGWGGNGGRGAVNVSGYGDNSGGGGGGSGGAGGGGGAGGYGGPSVSLIYTTGSNVVVGLRGIGNPGSAGANGNGGAGGAGGAGGDGGARVDSYWTFWWIFGSPTSAQAGGAGSPGNAGTDGQNPPTTIAPARCKKWIVGLGEGYKADKRTVQCVEDAT